MKQRLITALRAVGLDLHTDATGEDHIQGVPDKIQDLARRITPQDYRMMYVLLMKYPEISAEWVLRGTGTMILPDGIINNQRIEIERLREELAKERKKSGHEDKSESDNSVLKKRGRPRKF